MTFNFFTDFYNNPCEKIIQVAWEGRCLQQKYVNGKRYLWHIRERDSGKRRVARVRIIQRVKMKERTKRKEILRRFEVIEVCIICEKLLSTNRETTPSAEACS